MRLRAAGLFERVDGGVCHYHTAVLDYSFVTFDGFIDPAGISTKTNAFRRRRPLACCSSCCYGGERPAPVSTFIFTAFHATFRIFEDIALGINPKVLKFRQRALERVYDSIPPFLRGVCEFE